MKRCFKIYFLHIYCICNMAFLAVMILLLSGSSPYYPGEIDLSGAGWKAWPDKNAGWADDTLYLPSEIQGVLAKLPVNEPTGGWEALDKKGLDVCVPKTMDEYLSGGINTCIYEGVSWVWRTFEVPSKMQGKILLLQVEKARLRAEVYINKQLAAYNVIGETPFESDISSYICYGKRNTIAVRLTNPEGHRGWNDGPVNWGTYTIYSNGANFPPWVT